MGILLSGEVHQVACVLSFILLLPHFPKTSRVYLCAIMKSRFGTEPWNSTSLRPAYVIGVSCYQNPVTTSECHGYLRLSAAGTAVQRFFCSFPRPWALTVSAVGEAPCFSEDSSVRIFSPSFALCRFPCHWAFILQCDSIWTMAGAGQCLNERMNK